LLRIINAKLTFASSWQRNIGVVVMREEVKLRVGSVRKLSFWLMRKEFMLLLLVACVNLVPSQANAHGKGPIGLWPATERYLLVADSSLPGIVLVDLKMGTVIERLLMKGKNPTCITSCPDCNFAFMTGKSGSSWRVYFESGISKLLKNTGKLDLKYARIEAVDLSFPGGSKKGKIDARICLLSDGGERAYIASSKDNSVFFLEMSKKPSVRRLFKARGVEPYGLNWAKDGSILVAMHKKAIWRIDNNGVRLASYNVKDAKCPGTSKYNPNLRTAIDDPLNSNSIIILASNPRTYDAVLWRLRYDQRGRSVACETLSGKIGGDSGWVDSSDGGKKVQFSRPHYFQLLPDGTESKIVITDIDNRALRIVSLVDGSSSTVMYDRDRRLASIPVKERKSTISCKDQHWVEAIDTFDPLGSKSCVRPPVKKSFRLTYKQAKSYCKAEGARLCEPIELRQSGVLPNKVTWTAASCASCWHAKPGQQCAPVIKTLKTPGVHKSKGFAHSWHSGQAVEVGGLSPNGPATFCASKTREYKAEVVCCADHF
jgi:hypothetical protein